MLRRLKNHRHSRKGVSGLIAAIMLFAMLFTTGATYFVFTTDIHYDLQDAARSAIQRDIERESEKLDVTTLKLSDNDLGITITNIGPVPVQVIEIMIMNSNGSLIKDIQNPTLPITFNADELTSTTIDTNLTIVSGSQYSTKVITERGTIISAIYPPPSSNVTSVVSSEISKAIGSVSMDTTTLQYSQDDGNNWSDGWRIPGNADTIWRVNVTNLVERDIYLSNFSSFLFLKIVSGGGGQLQPRTFYITTAYNENSYPEMEHPNFLTDGGILLPANGGGTVTLYLKIDNPGSGSGVSLDTDSHYYTILELFGKYDSPTSNEYYGQSLPFVGVLVE